MSGSLECLQIVEGLCHRIDVMLSLKDSFVQMCLKK